MPADSTHSVAPVAAAYRDVSKHFGATRALSGITLDIHEGTIHALVGENGAGKSTALGILAGRIGASAGELELFGQPLPPLSPRDARALGIATIYQELTIVPDLSAEANVFVGNTLSRFGLVDTKLMRARYEALCAELGVDAVPVGTPAGSLSVAGQQLLEIMRAMASDARMILFDEPTASLGMTERRALLELMKTMRSDGRTVVFVSHNLDEVLEVADVITVFRGGTLVTTELRSNLDKRQIVQHMLGDADRGLLRALDEESAPPRELSSHRVDSAAPLLRVESLTIPGAIEDISFEVYPGEVLGLGGLVGSGRTSVLRALAGMEPRATGFLWIDGNEVPWPRTVRKAIALGIALAPEDRKKHGLVLEMPAALNVTMSGLRSVSRFGFISERRLRTAAVEAARPYGFDTSRLDEAAKRLSGGNQQKLLLARWLHSEPRILLTDEPTRGIDIGAKEDVLTSLRGIVARGRAVIFVSSELEEMVAVCDRVDVLAEGRLAGRLDRAGTGISVPQILERAFAA